MAIPDKLRSWYAGKINNANNETLGPFGQPKRTNYIPGTIPNNNQNETPRPGLAQTFASSPGANLYPGAPPLPGNLPNPRGTTPTRPTNPRDINLPPPGTDVYIPDGTGTPPVTPRTGKNPLGIGQNNTTNPPKPPNPPVNPPPDKPGLLKSVTMPDSALTQSNTYNPTLVNNPYQWNVKANETTSGNLDRILKSDSPLMQQARAEGLRQAGARGLLNSSIAGGAAQAELIRNAVPIAQSDADVYSRAGGYNASTANEFKTLNQQVQNQASQFGAEAKNRAGEFNATNKFGEYQNEFEKQQQLFQANVESSLRQIDNEFKFSLQSQDIFGGLSKGFTDAMTMINTDKNMNQKSKDYAINQLFETYRAQISLLSAVGSVPDVSELLTFEVTA